MDVYYLSSDSSQQYLSQQYPPPFNVAPGSAKGLLPASTILIAFRRLCKGLNRCSPVNLFALDVCRPRYGTRPKTSVLREAVFLFVDTA